MFSLLNPYLIGGALAALILTNAATGLYGYSKGKEAVLNRLKDDRITVLKDGVKIDNDVLASDDFGLCDKLGGCE
ncbi:MAG: hypothetical protein M9944_13100 [Rhizobiaceae bacterium]|nr:hypothetical protein [Rhizobiaceae bacterium]